MNEQVVEVLRGARAELATPGRWWNGSAQALPSETTCASTAISGQVGDAYAVVALGARDYIKRAIGFDPADSVTRIYLWNDAPGRTLNEVLSAYDRAIALAEADAQTTAQEV